MSNSQEGLRKIVKSISFIAWFWLTMWIIIAISGLFSGYQITFAFMVTLLIMSVGVVGFILIQGLAWIIARLAGLSKERNGLIRWADIKARIAGKNKKDLVKESAVNLTGIQGWLRFFCLSLVLSSLYFLANFYNDKRDTYQQYPDLINNNAFTHFMSAYELLSWMSALLFTAAFFLLIKYKIRSTLNKVIIAIWLAAPVSILLQIIVMRFYLPEADISYAIVMSVIRGIFYCIIWTSYLRLSKRVKNTYL